MNKIYIEEMVSQERLHMSLAMRFQKDFDLENICQLYFICLQ